MVIVAPGFQATQRGRDACVASYREFTDQATIHEYIESDTAIDLWGNTAVATNRFQIAYDMDGGSHRESGWDLFVFRRDNGTWRAVWRTLIVSA